MDRPNSAPRSADGPSSFFAQRGATADGHARPSATPEPLRAGGSQGGQTDRMAEAKRFEEEKRGVIESLFGKQDESGKPYQNYITHIKVIENAAYPTSPPPPEYNTPEHNKERFIILSVKASGRVWMHKARLNPDRTFQIGKSWPMEELQSIETFNPALARTSDERERAERAGPLGFAITMAKPYYWRAEKLLEKGHFIQSIIRVYTKFTGNIPNLIGFAPKERERIIGAVQAMSPATPQNRRDQQPAPLSIPDRSSQPTRRPSDQSSIDARSISIASPGPQRPPSRGLQQKPQADDNDYASPQPLSGQWQPASAVERQLRPQKSHEFSSQHGRPQQFVQQENASGDIRSNTDSPQPQPLRSVHGNMSQMNGRDSATASRVDLAERNAAAQRSAVLPETRSSAGTPITMSTAQRWRPEGLPPVVPNGPGENAEQSRLSSETTASQASHAASTDSRQVLPERRRPPLLDQASQRSSQGISNRTPPAPSNSFHQTHNDISRPSTGGRLVDANASRLPGANGSGTASYVAADQALHSASEEIMSPSGFLDQLEAAAKPAALRTVPFQPAHEAQQGSPTAIEVPAGPKYRPGLGPMMGTKNEPVPKSGTPAPTKSGFKPRAGGAGERLLKRQKSDDVEGPLKASAPRTDKADVRDELTGTNATVNEAPESPSESVEALQKVAPAPAPIVTKNLEDISATGPIAVHEASTSQVNQPPEAARKRDSIKAKPRSNVIAKSLAALDIDPYVLGDRELNYELVLADFGWEENMLDAKQVDSLQAGLRREIARLEAGSWIGHPEQKDERITQVGKLLDKAISECDTMDSLLRLYSVELSTLNEDIAYIEAQSQGLQVQTANQKLLQTELQKMVSTITIGHRQLEPLARSSLQDSRGLAEIEDALLMLYQALLTIDPSIVHGDTGIAAIDDSPARLTNMRALQEKKDFYLNEAQTFLLRLRNSADPTFGMAFQRTKDIMRRNKGTNDAQLNLDLGAHDLGRSQLWQYSPLMLFAKTIDIGAWQDLIMAYTERARVVYQDELRDNQMQWKKAGRKIALDEQEALFTHQEKEIMDNSSSSGGSLGSAARKLTVKRSQTLAKTLGRSAGLDKRAILDKSQDSRLNPAESFAAALDEAIPLIFTEQNFIVDFFHASSLSAGDFDDAVRLLRPSERQGTDLLAKKPPETDRAAAKRVLDAMEGVFATWPSDLQGLVDWATAADPFQGVGVLCALERKRLELEDSSQTFILVTLQRLTERLTVAFTRFVDIQIRAIEEMKVKTNKRKGVHSIVRVFPNFTTLVESMLPPADGQEQLELRTMIDQAYARISRAIFDGLRAIAKETPSGAGYGASADPEDKEALNYHILLIENMYHFYTEVEERGDAVLGEWRGKAMMAMAEHQEHYVSAVIRRPLGKLLDFVESTDGTPSFSAGNHAVAHGSHSRSAFKKALSSCDSKEVRRGIETLRRRIEKHFGDGDDYGGSQKLIANIAGECERRYYDLLERAQRLATETYEGTVAVEFGKEDIAQGFRR